MNKKKIIFLLYILQRIFHYSYGILEEPKKSANKKLKNKKFRYFEYFRVLLDACGDLHICWNVFTMRILVCFGVRA